MNDFGGLEKPENVQLKDLSGREIAALLPIALLIVWIGVYPSPFLKLTAASSNHLLSQLQNSRVVKQKGHPEMGPEVPSDSKTSGLIGPQ